MPNDTLIRKKPLFPIQYGILIENVMGTFNILADRGLKITQLDVMRLHSKISNMEAFVKPLIVRNQDYDGDKADLMDEFSKQRTMYGQIAVLRKWFALINTVVDDMYFDIAGISKYEPHS